MLFLDLIPNLIQAQTYKAVLYINIWLQLKHTVFSKEYEVMCINQCQCVVIK